MVTTLKSPPCSCFPHHHYFHLMTYSIYVFLPPVIIDIRIYLECSFSSSSGISLYYFLHVFPSSFLIYPLSLFLHSSPSAIPHLQSFSLIYVTQTKTFLFPTTTYQILLSHLSFPLIQFLTSSIFPHFNFLFPLNHINSTNISMHLVFISMPITSMHFFIFAHFIQIIIFFVYPILVIPHKNHNTYILGVSGLGFKRSSGFLIFSGWGFKAYEVKSLGVTCHAGGRDGRRRVKKRWR